MAWVRRRLTADNTNEVIFYFGVRSILILFQLSWSRAHRWRFFFVRQCRCTALAGGPWAIAITSDASMESFNTSNCVYRWSAG